MLFKIILVLCVIQISFSQSDDCNNGYTRIKRSKYYSNPPPRFYRKPPAIYPIRGPFSYTPPPGYMDDGDKNPGPPAPSYKVSKRKEGLGEEDFHNLIKYLSKQDLDRIVELAGERNRHTERYPSREQTNSYKNSELDFDPSKIPFSNDQKTSNIDYNSRPNYVQKPDNSLDQVHQYLDPEESQQISYLNGHIQKELNNIENHQSTSNSNTGNVVFTDSDTMKEEQLPRPQNLRDASDYDASYTHNVPSIVKAESSSYKLENFADLPLMNYEHSKLETVNSYSVPHYTVTSTRNQVSPQFSAPPLPPAINNNNKAVAAQQSDAHLKAVKIWTHKSTGTAYTLHDDGTLSLERPDRPKHF